MEKKLLEKAFNAAVYTGVMHLLEPKEAEKLIASSMKGYLERRKYEPDEAEIAAFIKSKQTVADTPFGNEVHDYTEEILEAWSNARNSSMFQPRFVFVE